MSTVLSAFWLTEGTFLLKWIMKCVFLMPWPTKSAFSTFWLTKGVCLEIWPTKSAFSLLWPTKRALLSFWFTFGRAWDSYFCREFCLWPKFHWSFRAAPQCLKMPLFTLVLGTYPNRGFSLWPGFSLSFCFWPKFSLSSRLYVTFDMDYRNKLRICVVGPWQWPYRGVRVGEASHPGPPFMTRALTAAELVEEDLFGDLDDDVTQETDGGVPTPMGVHRGPDVEVLSLEGSQVIDALFIDPGVPIVLSPDINVGGPAASADPLLRCPLCTGYGARGLSRNLISHLTVSHHGECLPEVACEVLRGLDRGTCCGEGCGGLRLISSKCCSRCSNRQPPRRLQAGDKIGGITAVRRYEDVGSITGTSLADEGYREAFSKRVTILPPTSLLHVPVALRQRHALVMASLLEGIAESTVEACALEHARTKLLLGPVPRNNQYSM